MIQRVQSLYLLSGALAILATIFFPFVRIISGSTSGFIFLHTFKSDAVLAGAYNPLLVLLTGVLTALCFIISIFLYKNRVKQMRFNAFVFVLNCALIGAIFWASDSFAKALNGIADYKQIGILLPLVSMLLLVFSNRAIKKDEMKVRAADRLR